MITLPIVVATVRALTTGWLALGDSALLGIRAADVGTRHHPFLGSWSSSSLTLGEEVHNPGPLYLDLVAGPLKALGPSVGLAVGVMAVNVAASVIAVLTARRVDGRRGLMAVTAAIVAIEWTMGSELLFDIWQPNALVLPMMAMIVVTWALAAADIAALPLALGIGSVIVQTHLSFLYLTLVLVAAGLALAVVGHRRGPPGPGSGRALALWRTPLVASGIVLSVAWAQPLWQQFVGSGPGNLTSLLSAAGRDSSHIGLGRGVELVAARMVLPPWWDRSSYDADVGALPSTVVASIAVAILVAALVVIERAVASDRALQRMVDVSMVLICGCLVTFALMPRNVTGFVPHTWRWLWPASAFVTVSILSAASTLVPPARKTAVRMSAVAVVVLVALASLPTHVAGTGPTAYRDVTPTAEALVSQASVLEDRGPLLFDTTTLAFEDPYHTALLTELQHRGVPFVFDGPDVAQFGDARRYDGSARWRIWERTGVRALGPEPGASRVMFVDGLGDVRAARLAELEAELADPLDERGLTLTDAGRAALERGELELDPGAIAPGAGAFAALAFYGHLVNNGTLAAPPDLADGVAELLALRRIRDRYTVAVYLAPASVRPVPG